MKTAYCFSRLSLIMAAVLYYSAPALATPLLGSTQNFAVLGASTVTNTGPTTVKGDIGVYPGTSMTGMGSVSLTGTVQQANAFSQQAQIDATNAYNFLAGRQVTSNLTSQDLGGLTLNPGVYFFASSAQLTGALTLDAQNNPNAMFIFQIGSTLTTASNSMVNVLNGGSNNGVYWQVGSSATLDTNTRLVGNILANQSITLNTNAGILGGRAIALNGAVTMDTNTISNSFNGANSSDYGSYGFSGYTSAVPEPSTLPLLTFGLVALGFTVRRHYN